MSLADGGERKVYPSGAIKEPPRVEKGRYDLIPPGPLHRLAVHYARGAEKYPPGRTWEAGLPWSVLIGSALRHAFQWLAGANDEDHLAACAWQVFALMDGENRHRECCDIPARVGAYQAAHRVATELKAAEDIVDQHFDLSAFKGKGHLTEEAFKAYAAKQGWEPRARDGVRGITIKSPGKPDEVSDFWRSGDCVASIRAFNESKAHAIIELAAALKKTPQEVVEGIQAEAAAQALAAAEWKK